MLSFKFWMLPSFLIGVLFYMQYHLWFEPGGLCEMYRLKKQLAIELKENDKLKKRNDLLIQQVQQIQKNNNAVEAHARHELGMIKKGETFYQVVNK